MQNNYTVINKAYLDHAGYRQHFLSEAASQTTAGRSIYGVVHRAQFSPTVLELEKALVDAGFPSIDYYLFFRHTRNQPIHVDGHSFVRNASLNLALSGYRGTLMNYYSIINDVRTCTDAQYFHKSNVQFTGAFEAVDEWVLVNSAEPHNITGPTALAPRVTVCFRFAGNPTYTELRKLLPPVE